MARPLTLGAATPWVMQLVAHVEKDDPPSHTAVCEAAAVAVLQLLADERCGRGGPWRDAVQRWRAIGIRKHARRARGAAWERVAALEGVAAAVAGAEVRALPPTPIDEVPRDVARLQLQGFELDDPDRRAAVEPERGGAVVIGITPTFELPTGKAAAAAGHAAQLAAEAMRRRRRRAWAAAGFPVLVEHSAPERWGELLRVAPVVVRDAGHTEVPPGTVTAMARWA